ncbi:MAG TPA: SDR family oxidoreductase [Paucimonas sp.]|nr:SDR family oxidoreductase [Paucimonas sp.]
MQNFKDKVAVITGAASGFGREFAIIGARLGMKLVLTDVQHEQLDATAGELAAQGADVLAVRCDVRHAEEVQAVADRTMERFGAMHLVFNNAGVGCGGLMWESSQADWDWVLGVNLWGVIHGVRIFTPLMLECAKKEPGYQGHIVNTASMAGMMNPPVLGVYNVSKSAVIALSESLYQDLKLIDAPIGASVLCPYFVPTGISKSHRSRPDDVKMTAAPTASQAAAQAMVDKAVSSGKVSAAEVAEMTFDAIREERFYIYSHPKESPDNIRIRMESIVNGTNPSDPYEATPKMRDALKAQLKGGQQVS